MQAKYMEEFSASSKVLTKMKYKTSSLFIKETEYDYKTTNISKILQFRKGKLGKADYRLYWSLLHMGASSIDSVYQIKLSFFNQHEHIKNTFTFHLSLYIKKRKSHRKLKIT